MHHPGRRVTQLWRYPVKSLAGEALPQADVTERGIEGDRSFGLVDVDTGLVLTARRVPELLFAAPRHAGRAGARPLIQLPDGTATDDDATLSAWLRRRVELRAAGPGERGRYEIAENDDRPDGAWRRWEGPEGVFHDSATTQLSIVSEASLGAWDVRRFRPNVVLSGGDERDLVGRALRLGTVEVEVVKEITRCVIVTRAQPSLERDKDVLVQVHRRRGGTLGVAALVRATGRVALGDAVAVL